MLIISAAILFIIYNARGFQVTDIHADVEFDKIKIAILPVRAVDHVWSRRSLT